MHSIYWPLFSFKALSVACAFHLHPNGLSARFDGEFPAASLKVGPGGAVTFSENPESLGGDAGDLLVQNWEGPVELAVEEGGAGAASSLFGGLSGAGVLAAAGGTLLVASVAGGGGGGGGSDGTASTDTAAESSFVPTSPTSFTSGGNQVVAAPPKTRKKKSPQKSLKMHRKRGLSKQTTKFC